MQKTTNGDKKNKQMIHLLTTDLIYICGDWAVFLMVIFALFFILKGFLDLLELKNVLKERFCFTKLFTIKFYN
ncbi:hypothetical protein HanHA300_Chr15g0574171 [Helianthus annuus]|nr:hypothetical protein HanHA300_Chr15g0574171 [Helianthus annuus]KAJ0473903.1 hypothetical protein HanHA89_Chr15g0623641 [Helianthus annuus]KAJ0782575.1 hypothetical protein HanLR1_Chr01g0009781 [Helianthus annuus]